MTKKREFSEGKKNIIAGLLEEYDIQSAEDIQEALKDLLGGTIQNIMEAELSEHLGYERTNRTVYKGQQPTILNGLPTYIVPFSKKLIPLRDKLARGNTGLCPAPRSSKDIFL